MHPKVRDLAKSLVAQIAAALDAGGMWKSARMTKGGRPPINALTKNRYNGINALALWIEQQRKIYWSNEWLTFRQKCELEARIGKPLRIRKGEEATTGLKVKDFIPAEFKKEGDKYRNARTGQLVSERGASRRFWKPFNVFNLAQFEELPDEVAVKPELLDKPAEPQTQAMLQFFDKLNPTIKPHANECFFNPKEDFIGMVPREFFTDENRYCSTLAHEMTHWTGHKSRLDRVQLTTSNPKGMQAPEYCFEELIAEIGALLLCAEFDIPPMMSHALYATMYVRYLEQWEEKVIDAAGQADRAVRWMLEKGGRLAAKPYAGADEALPRAA